MPHAPYATDWGPGWVSWDSEGIDAVRLPGSVLPADTAHIAPPEVTELCGVLGRHFAGRGDLPDGSRFHAVAGSPPSTRRIYEGVGSDGTLRGYAGGLEMKLRMLVMEGAR